MIPRNVQTLKNGATLKNCSMENERILKRYIDLEKQGVPPLLRSYQYNTMRRELEAVSTHPRVGSAHGEFDGSLVVGEGGGAARVVPLGTLAQRLGKVESLVHRVAHLQGHTGVRGEHLTVLGSAGEYMGSGY